LTYAHSRYTVVGGYRNRYAPDVYHVSYRVHSYTTRSYTGMSYRNSRGIVAYRSSPARSSFSSFRSTSRGRF
jgi:hypothetical protein